MLSMADYAASSQSQHSTVRGSGEIASERMPSQNTRASAGRAMIEQMGIAVNATGDLGLLRRTASALTATYLEQFSPRVFIKFPPSSLSLHH